MARPTPTKDKWFPLPNDPDKGEILVRHLKQGEVNDIEDRVSRLETVVRRDPDGVAREEMRVVYPKGEDRYLYFCAALRDWKNFFGLDGKPLECTDANKIMMARDDQELVKFVGECRAALAEEAEREQEAARKNSKTSGAGSPA